uniref:Uncharacterized protein n=1 Tax=Anguilla anguilla TaxID=7936 RepID=A0A0E9XR21_ANGAN
MLNKGSAEDLCNENKLSRREQAAGISQQRKPLASF